MSTTVRAVDAHDVRQRDTRRVRGRSSRPTGAVAPTSTGAREERAGRGSSTTRVGVTALPGVAVDRAVAGDHPRLQTARRATATCGDESSSRVTRTVAVPTTSSSTTASAPPPRAAGCDAAACADARPG